MSESALLDELFGNDASLGAAVSVIRWLNLRGSGHEPEGDGLGARALARVEDFFERADQGDFAALAEIAATDPVSVLHALLPLADAQRRFDIAGLYVEILAGCIASGIEIVRPNAAPMVALLLRRLGHPDPPFADCPGNEDESFTAAAFALRVLEASDAGDARIERPSEDLRLLSRASLLMAARRRNCADAGLFLLAHSICFEEDDVSHVIDWLRRIRRSDGLYGTWELFADSRTAANLAASVNVEWALAGRGQARSPGAPKRMRPIPALADAFEPLDESETRAAIARLRTWTDDNLDRFLELEFSDQAEYGDRIKPLVELILALWVVTRIVPGSAHDAWARGHAASIAQRVAGEALIEGIRIFPTSILAALMFPMLDHMTGEPHRHAAEVRALVEDRFSQSQERIPMRQMDYFFLRWLLSGGSQEDDDAIHDSLRRALVSGGANPCFLTNDSAYDITHAIFYATKFGTAPFAATDEARAWCAGWIPELCLSFLLEEDLDVGCELLMNWTQLRLPRGGGFWFALRLVLDNLSDDGSAPGPKRQVDYDGLSPFERDYHTTLIVLIALIGTLPGADADGG